MVKCFSIFKGIYTSIFISILFLSFFSCSSEFQDNYQESDADCETLQNMYASKVEAAKDDLPALKEIVSLLRRVRCQEIDAFYTAAGYAYKLEPSADAALGIAKHDFGIDRIEPRYRKPYIQPQSYDEILGDLTPINLQDFDTLVFDTGGKLISLMSLWAIKKDPKYGQRDASLSLKGYGFVGKEFVRLMDYCFYELQKNIVIVFHATEEKDGDNTRLRIKVEGQTKNNVWEPMDLGGFVEIYGNDRTIGFSNCERYFAKGTRGISGIRKIPALGPTSPNDFLTKLFAEYNAKATAEVEQNAVDQAVYEAAMVEGTAIIADIVDADTANAAMPKYQAIKHALTSNKELGVLWNKKIKERGLFFDKVLKKYTPAPEEAKEAE